MEEDPWCNFRKLRFSLNSTMTSMVKCENTCVVITGTNTSAAARKNVLQKTITVNTSCANVS